MKMIKPKIPIDKVGNWNYYKPTKEVGKLARPYGFDLYFCRSPERQDPAAGTHAPGKDLVLKARVIAKPEHFNPVGAVKDRVAKAMIHDAKGRWKALGRMR